LIRYFYFLKHIWWYLIMQLPTPVFKIFFHYLSILTGASKQFWEWSIYSALWVCFSVVKFFVGVWVITISRSINRCSCKFMIVVIISDGVSWLVCRPLLIWFLMMFRTLILVKTRCLTWKFTWSLLWTIVKLIILRYTHSIGRTFTWHAALSCSIHESAHWLLMRSREASIETAWSSCSAKAWTYTLSWVCTIILCCLFGPSLSGLTNSLSMFQMSIICWSH